MAANAPEKPRTTVSLRPHWDARLTQPSIRSFTNISEWQRISLSGCAAFQNPRRGAVYPKAPGFTPAVQLRLAKLAYRHVRPSDDVRHEGTYTPDTRDNAENARDNLLGAVLDLSGSEGWSTKMAMINDPLFARFSDRGRILAEQKAAEEVDAATLSESEFKTLDTYGEAPPNTLDAMYQLLRDRLDDIDDALLQDTSPREQWALIEDERVMRRAIARELNAMNNHLYTVDQEAATADEKETDIRLRSTSSPQQATIELKIGEKDRSAADFRSALKDQLLTKYMAAEHAKVGCLMITVVRIEPGGTRTLMRR